MKILIIYTVVTLVLVLVLQIYLKLAVHFGITDHPNHRSSHQQVTIRGGGVILPLALLLAFFINNFAYPFFISGLVLISVISFVDDITPLSYKSRLLVQMAAVVLLLMELECDVLWWYLLLPVPLLAFINASNFMDGINGITGVFGLITFISILVINYFIGGLIQTSYLIYALMAISIFLFYNFRKKAVCFAGDVGSISMAFIIAFFIVSIILKTGNWLYLGMVMVFAVDSSTTIAMRLRKGARITEPHRTHLYQLLANEYGMSHLMVASIYGMLQVVVNGVLFLLFFLQLIVIYQFLILIFIYAFISVAFNLFRKQIQNKINSSSRKGV